MIHSYRTVDRYGNILESWDKRHKVKPQYDYHVIQHIRMSDNPDAPPIIMREWWSMFEFINTKM